MKDQITINRNALMGLYVLAGVAIGIIISDITNSSFIEPAYAAAGSGKYVAVPDANGDVWVIDSASGTAAKCTDKLCTYAFN